MNLVVTDNPSMIQDIAKQIVLEKKDYYTDDVLNSIRKVIVDRAPKSEDFDLEKELYKTIYYYWVYGCTAIEYYYLYFYRMSYDEIKEYVTMREKVIYRNHLNAMSDAHLLNNKWDTYNYFQEYFKRDVILLRNENDYNAFLSFIDKHNEFVVKPVDMGGGHGVHKVVLEKQTTVDEKRRIFNELLQESKDNRKKFLRGSEDALVLEEVIQQDQRMAAFNPNSVNAVRATTVKVGNNVHIYHPFFKIGRGGHFLTSAIFGTLDAEIDVDTGIVVTPGYTETNEIFNKHPDTNLDVLGFQIPRWDELVNTVKELALKLENINYVGWDMVLSPNGWVLMEGNFSGDFMWQLFEKRGCKKEFEDLIGWKLTKQFWWEE